MQNYISLAWHDSVVQLEGVEPEVRTVFRTHGELAHVIGVAILISFHDELVRRLVEHESLRKERNKDLITRLVDDLFRTSQVVHNDGNFSVFDFNDATFAGDESSRNEHQKQHHDGADKNCLFVYVWHLWHLRTTATTTGNLGWALRRTGRARRSSATTQIRKVGGRSHRIEYAQDTHFEGDIGILYAAACEFSQTPQI